MRAGHDLRGAVFRSERVKEGQRRNRLGEAGIPVVAMQELRATAEPRLAPFDLCQEEWPLQDVVCGGKQRRQSANILHCRVEIKQGVAPIMATRGRPFVGWQRAGLKCGAEWLDPARRDDAAQQKKAFVVKTPSVF